MELAAEAGMGRDGDPTPFTPQTRSLVRKPSAWAGELGVIRTVPGRSGRYIRNVIPYSVVDLNPVGIRMTSVVTPGLGLGRAASREAASCRVRTIAVAVSRLIVVHSLHRRQQPGSVAWSLGGMVHTRRCRPPGVSPCAPRNGASI
jgi:hypothetical protein